VSSFSVTLDLPHSAEALFRYLAEPRNRPEWQASLKAVTDIDPGEPHEGMRWCDVTKVGLRPQLRLTEVTPFRTLSEVGTWRGVDGLLTLRFVQAGDRTHVTAEGRVEGRGPFAVAAAVAGRWAPMTIKSDLERASANLTGSQP
jgi:uncharacterized protein YndB with AHSA1/START domain